MALGAITEVTEDLGIGSETVSNIDPHTFFLIFLPPLIFESAFSIDWHIIKVELAQILILAGPCLLVCAFLTAIVMRWILQYQGEFTFEAAIMFGALISATDPVAVVALLKELGASRTLSTLIEGESLFNDGTAYVMFSVTLELVKGKEPNAGEIIGQFCRLSFGGPALGIAFGMAASFWLRRIINNSILETNLTIFTAYLMFYTAEATVLHVSGILGLVCLGLYMTKEGRTKISSMSEETMHHIWSFLGYSCETLVFIFAGVIITLQVWEEESVIGWADWLKCIALYFFLHIIRAGVIFAIKWPMNKIGYGLGWREGIVLSYAGLRGAVSLLLALIVKLDHDVNHEIRDIVVFHTAFIAILTLCVNGTTMGFLVRKLGLMRMPEVKKKMLRNLIKAYRKEVNETIETLKSKKNFGKVDWDKLKEIAGTDKVKGQIFKKRSIQPHRSDLQGSQTMNDLQMVLDRKDDYTEDELYIEAKHRYLTALKGIYWDYFEQGQSSPQTVQLLIESAARAIDHEEDELKDFTFIESYFHRTWFDKVYIKLQRTWVFRWLVKNWLYIRLSFEYDAVVNYIEAHEECMETIEQIVNNEAILGRLKSEIYKEMKKAEIKLYKHIEENFPEVTKAIQHRRGGYYLINHMYHFVEEMVKHGQMESKEAHYFLHHLTKESKKLVLGKLSLEFEHPDEDLTTHSQLSKIFTHDEIENLCKHFTSKTFDRGEVIIKKGQPLKNLYYISKGVVHEKTADIADIDCPKIRNRPGDLLGLQFLTKDSGVAFSNCYAKTVCTCRIFPISVLRSMIKTKDQEVMLWSYVGPSIIKLRPDQFSRLLDLNEREIKALIQSCDYKAYVEEEEISLETGGILIEGVIEKVLQNNEDDSSVESSYSGEGKEHVHDKKGIKKSFCFIYPSDKKYIARSECRIFHMPPSLKEGLLSLNLQIFHDAFHKLDKVEYLDKHHKVKEHHKNLKKEKTTLIGIPSQLAHDDPFNMFRDKRLAAVHKYGRGGDKSLPRGSSRDSMSRRNSIVPRGEPSSTKKVAPLKLNNSK